MPTEICKVTPNELAPDVTSLELHPSHEESCQESLFLSVDGTVLAHADSNVLRAG